jgi:hypothetical protein
MCMPRFPGISLACVHSRRRCSGTRALLMCRAAGGTGIDVQQVSLVINYDLPTVRFAPSYHPW